MNRPAGAAFSGAVSADRQCILYSAAGAGVLPTCAGTTLAAADGIQRRAEFTQIGKDKWPFTREEVMLTCEKDGALFAINPSTLLQYPLNDKALARGNTGQGTLQSIDTILAADKAHPGQKMSLQPIVDRAQQLCGK